MIKNILFFVYKKIILKIFKNLQSTKNNNININNIFLNLHFLFFFQNENFLSKLINKLYLKEIIKF